MKKRLDILLVDKGYFKTRTKAQANIMAGNVLVDDFPITKSGTKIDEKCIIRIRKKAEYVGRGAYKLKKALEVFDVEVKDRICADIGSSTGGFTELLLLNGAKLVYAVDVGTNQLDYSLRINEQVIVMEKTNARYLSMDSFSHRPSLITVDVSFISLTIILDKLIEIVKDGGDIISLIKPQFEIGKEIEGFKGVVRETNHLKSSLLKIYSYLTGGSCFPIIIKDFTYSPLKGPKGNIEYLVHIKKSIGTRHKNHFSNDFFLNLVNNSKKHLKKNK